MDQTVGQLRSNLTPSKLASEAASRVGMTELSWRGAVDFASTRHPGPTAIAGFGVALWLLAAARKRHKEGVHEVTLPLRESSSSLVDTATRVFRERAATKQREFIGAAQTQVAKGAAMLSDAIEDKLEDVIDRVRGGSQVRPLIESTVQGGARGSARSSFAEASAHVFALEPGAAESGSARLYVGALLALCRALMFAARFNAANSFNNRKERQ
jgi:hypothetical protein